MRPDLQAQWDQLKIGQSGYVHRTDRMCTRLYKKSSHSYIWDVHGYALENTFSLREDWIRLEPIPLTIHQQWDQLPIGARFYVQYTSATAINGLMRIKDTATTWKLDGTCTASPFVAAHWSTIIEEPMLPKKKYLINNVEVTAEYLKALVAMSRTPQTLKDALTTQYPELFQPEVVRLGTHFVHANCQSHRPDLHNKALLLGYSYSPLRGFEYKLETVEACVYLVKYQLP